LLNWQIAAAAILTYFNVFFAAINAKIKKDWRIYTNADNFFFFK
jgi:hypothetical protein